MEHFLLQVSHSTSTTCTSTTAKNSVCPAGLILLMHSMEKNLRELRGSVRCDNYSQDRLASLEGLHHVSIVYHTIRKDVRLHPLHTRLYRENCCPIHWTKILPSVTWRHNSLSVPLHNFWEFKFLPSKGLAHFVCWSGQHDCWNIGSNSNEQHFHCSLNFVSPK